MPHRPSPTALAARALGRPKRRPRGHEIAYFGYSVTGYDGETTSQEDLFVVSPSSGAVRRLTDDRSAPGVVSDRDPAWSPDRSVLAVHRSTGGPSVLHLVSSLTGATVDSLVEGFSPAWLDARTLLYLSSIDAGTGRTYDPGRTEVWCVDLVTRVTTRITSLGAGAHATTVSWHPTAGLALGYTAAGLPGGPAERDAVATVPVAVVAAARASGTLVTSGDLTFHTGASVNAGQPDWAPSGDALALVTWPDGGAARAAYLDLATGALTTVPAPPPGHGDHGPAWSPDGRTIAFARGDEDAWSEIWLYAVASGSLSRLTDDSRGRFKGSLDW